MLASDETSPQLGGFVLAADEDEEIIDYNELFGTGEGQ